MENQIGAFEDGGGGGGGGPYQSLPANDDIIAVASSSDDAHRLKQLGYKQELSRSLSAISNFSVTFSIISVITGLTTTFNYGLTYGGPMTMIWGWPIVGGFTLIVGLSMAEICSAYPTSGGLYFWSAKLCGNDWGPLASWLTGCTQMEQSQTQSTPSKSLRKRGSKQTQQQSANVHKASWDSDTVRIFLELVIKELDVGFKGSFHTMTMHGYRAISKAFLDRTNKLHDVKQLQNKYSLLKKDWQSWSKLMDSRHGPTGISYNEATGLIQASDDWWAHYEKVDKNAIKFKTKPLEHMDLMRRVYEGTTATGKYAWTPGAAFEPVATDDGTSPAPEEAFEDSSGLPPFQPAAQHEHTVHHTVAQEDGTPTAVHAASSGINVDDTPTSGRSKRKSPGPRHPQRKKGQSEGASLLASSMENLASSVKLQQRQIRVSHEYADSAQQLIQKCMRRLYSLEGLDPQDPLVPFAQSVLDNPANQAIMMEIPTDAAVIAWLRTKKSREQFIGGPSAPNSGMGGGWF